MKKVFPGLWFVALALVMASPCLWAQRLDATSGALIRAEMVSGWSLGARLQADHREFVHDGGELLEVDVLRFVLRGGLNLFPFLHVYGELGSATADTDREDGESGLCWAGGVRLRALEHVIDRSPVYGDMSSVDVTVDGQYRSTESNFDEDFSWNEWLVAPTLGFTMAHKEGNWRMHQPTAICLRGGVVFLDGEGDFGETTLEPNRNFGGLVALDALWRSGWSVRLSALMMSGQERELAFGVSRHF